MTVDERSPLLPESTPSTASSSSSLRRYNPQNSLQDVTGPRKSIPKSQIIVLLALALSEPVTNTVIYPFVNQLIEETGITKGNYGKVGYYAGIIVCTNTHMYPVVDSEQRVSRNLLSSSLKHS